MGRRHRLSPSKGEIMRNYANLQAVLVDEENLNWQGTLFANKQQCSPEGSL
jgi:hypothetical protein